MKSSRIEIKEGNSVIPIYKFSDGRFCVDAVIAGKRKRITRFSLDAAKLEARRILALVAKGRDSEEPLPNAEAEDYRMAKHKLAPYKISLHSVVEDWISLHLRSKNVIPKSVPEVVNEFLVAKQVEGGSPLHLSDRQSRLRKFAISFRGRVDRVTENEGEEWLNEKMLADLHRTMIAHRAAKSPFSALPAHRGRWRAGFTKAELAHCTWVEPRPVAQVRFTEWTDDGVLRHPAFLGPRDDKSAREVVRET